jgi:hypothetical protein
MESSQSDEIKQLEEMSESSPQNAEEQVQETPEQILDQVKSYLLQKFKEAGLTSYEAKMASTGIIVKYDGQRVDISHPKRDVIELLSNNSIANFFFGQFVRSLVGYLENIAYEKRRKKVIR